MAQSANRAPAQNSRPQRRRPPQQRRRPPQQMQAPPQQMQQQAPPQQMRTQAQWQPQNILNAGEKFAKVRKVMSGDTVRLESLEHFEFMVTLDGILAPRVSRSKQDDANNSDEAFGYESREFLRKLLIGAYVIVSGKEEDMQNLQPESNGRLKRIFGTLKVSATNPCGPIAFESHGRPEQWNSVTELVVSAGFGTVKGNVGEKFDGLRALEQQAREKGVGRWMQGDDARQIIVQHVRMVEWEPNVQNLFQSFRGKQIDGIIEEVREGSTVRVELIMPTQGGIQTQMIWVAMSGIQCPPMPKPKVIQEREYRNQIDRGENPGQFRYEPPSQIAVNAKRFVERRLLHQDVKVCLEHLDTNQNTLYGSVLFPKGDIAVKLLSQGLGHVVEWHVNSQSKQMYQNAEAFAKNNHAGIWAQESAPKFRPKKKIVAEANKWMCTQVYNGDCLILTDSQKDPKTTSKGELNKRVYLASLKCPRTANPRSKEPAEEYSFEAREYVRSRLVGQNITVRTQYTRTGNRGGELLEYVSISYDNNKDISTELVKAGLADIVPHSKKDPRVENYFQLQQFRDDAKAKKLGMWSEAPYKRPKLVDLTISGRKGDPANQRRETEIRNQAIKYMKEIGLGDNIQRNTREDRRKRRDKKAGNISGHIAAVVEYVFTSTRMKVRLVEKNMYVILLFAGIQGIRGQNLDQKTQLLVDETTEWVRRRVQQQEVFIQIENLDKYANFVGHLLIKEPGRKPVNLGFELLKLGAAKVFEPSAERSPMHHKLMSAQTEAQEGRVGLWRDWTPPVKQEEEEVQSQQPSEPKGPQKHAMEDKSLQAMVTYIDSATDFYAVQLNTPQKKKIEDYMATVNPANNQIYESFKPEAKDRVAGLYEGNYYRCSISSVSRKKEPARFFVNFLDYGNRGELSESQILPLVRNNGEGQDVADLPPLAIRCRLAGLKPPPAKNDDYCMEAGSYFANQVYFQEIDARILKVSRSKHQEVHEVEVTHNGVNVNDDMMLKGWARVDKKNYNVWGGGRRKEPCPFPDMLKRYAESAKLGYSQHVGMYRYGMVDSDDEE